MITGWSIQGVDIRTEAFNLESINGWDGMPGKQGRSVSVAFTHGGVSDPRKFYDPKDYVLPIIVLPYGATGLQSDYVNGGLAHERENLSIIMGLLHSDQLLDVRRTEPLYPGAGTVQWQGMSEFLEPLPVRKGIGPITRVFPVRLQLPVPFWRILPARFVGGFTTGTIETRGHAPISDMLISFSGAVGAQRLTYTADEWIEIDADTTVTPVIVDVGARTAMQGIVNVPVRFGAGWWMIWPSATPALALNLSNSGTADLSWYDKEF